MEFTGQKEDGTGVQDKLAKAFEAGAYVDVELDDITVGGLKVAKLLVKNDKAKATITDSVSTYKKGVRGEDAEFTLKAEG